MLAHQQWTQQWTKIKDAYTEIVSICEALKLAVKQCNQDFATASFFTMTEEDPSQNLNQLESSFMYTQIFKEILFEMKQDEKSIKDLADYCRQFHQDNMRELSIVNEFEREYRSRSPIWWYTRECFTYQMLNRALRTLEIDTIINMGFFICDLLHQIGQLHQQQISEYHGEPFIVYRGQGLSTIDFEKLLKAKGGLLSFNNFLSTSKNQDVSLRFAKSALTKTAMVGVVFQIYVDPSIVSTPFAAIREMSYFKKEEEILFSMHTVFRIGEINSIDDNSSLYQVYLELTSDDDQQLRILTNRIREEVACTTGWRQLGVLLLKLGQVDKAEELYKSLLGQKLDTDEKALCYNNLGYIKNKQADYKKALDIQEKTPSRNQSDLATCYNNIGLMYDNIGEYAKALSFYEKSLEIRQKILPPYHPDFAQSYNNIDSIYNNMKECLKALSFHAKALEIFQKILPSNHPDLAIAHHNIDSVYQNMGEYSKALPLCQKAHEIPEKTLPPNHINLADSYNNIAFLYYNMKQYSNGLLYLERARDILQSVLTANHPQLENVQVGIETLKKNLNI